MVPDADAISTDRLQGILVDPLVSQGAELIPEECRFADPWAAAKKNKILIVVFCKASCSLC